MQGASHHYTLIYNASGEQTFDTVKSVGPCIKALEPTLETLVEDFLRHQQHHLSANLDAESDASCQLWRLPSGDVLVELTFERPPELASHWPRLLSFQQQTASFLHSLLVDPFGSSFFDRALAHAIDLIPAAQTGSLLRRMADERFHYVATVGFDIDALREVSFDDSEVYFSFNERATSFVVPNIDAANVSLDERRTTILREEGNVNDIRSTLVVPLMLEGRAVAFFTLDNFDDTTAFTPDDQQIAETFASYTAVIMRFLDLNALFKQALYNLPYGTLLLNRDLEVILANPAFAELTGLDPQGTLKSMSLLGPLDLRALSQLKLGERHTWETRLHEGAGGHWCRVDAQHIQLDEPLYLMSFLDLSASHAFETHLQSVIDDLSREMYAMNNTVRRKLLSLQGGPNATQVSDLSEFELALLSNIVHDLSNPEMSELMRVPEGTVRNSVTALYRKLGVSSRVGAAVWAKDRGIH